MVVKNESSVAVPEKAKDTLSTFHKVMRLNSVPVRDNETDRRLFYCDDTVDIVVVTGFRRHIEPPHLHTRNTEIYYVIRGKLLLNVEGQDYWLDEGDLLHIGPGACHHFETTDEEVIFMAIKKEPRLKDKKTC